jgi:hypothetical protein
MFRCRAGLSDGLAHSERETGWDRQAPYRGPFALTPKVPHCGRPVSPRAGRLFGRRRRPNRGGRADFRAGPGIICARARSPASEPRGTCHAHSSPAGGIGAVPRCGRPDLLGPAGFYCALRFVDRHDGPSGNKSPHPPVLAFRTSNQD